MAVSNEFLHYILDQLEGVGVIHHKRLFSGVLLTVDNLQLGVILDESVYFTILDEALKTRFVHEGSVPFSYTRKDSMHPVVIGKWWAVPERYIDDAVALRALATEVLSQSSYLPRP